VLALILVLMTGCDWQPTSLDIDPSSPADSAVSSVVLDSDGVGAVVEISHNLGDRPSRLPTLYYGSGPGGAQFSPSGRYVAIYGWPQSDESAEDFSILDLVSGRASGIGPPQLGACEDIGSPVFSADSKRILVSGCGHSRVLTANKSGWRPTGSYRMDPDERLLAFSARDEALSIRRDSILIRAVRGGRIIVQRHLPHGDEYWDNRRGRRHPRFRG
jgi:hypothetical protein